MSLNTRDAQELCKKMQRAGILEIEYYRGSGPGGQHRNKTMSGVKLTATWRINGQPTTIRAQACLKSQQQSRRAALQVLMARLRIHVDGLAHRGRGEGSGFCGKYVRTYHEPDNRVIDHASGVQLAWTKVVEKGGLGQLVDARREAIASKSDSGKEFQI